MLIPFGLKNDRYYDVSEVERGRSCGCICPSCKQNLVAKKGDPEKMVHHFAHDKKAKDDLVDKVECKFSFCVAARLVIKQCFRELDSFQIELPDWKLQFYERDKYQREVSVSGYVTKAGRLTICCFSVEPTPPYNELDVLCHVGEHKFGIHFSYSGRPAVVSQQRTHISIIDIDLEPLQLLYQDFRGGEGYSFKDLAMEYALSEGDRCWISHARYEKRKGELKAKLSELLSQSNGNPPVDLPEKPIKINPFKKQRRQSVRQSHSVSVELHDGRCVRCQEGKVGYIDNLICSRCLQKYYAEGIFHTGDIKRAVVEKYIKQNG